MAKNNPIYDIALRKSQLQLEIRQKELEIGDSIRHLGEYFTLPAIKSSVISYALTNPDSAFRIGLLMVNMISRIVQGRKRKTRRRK